MRRAAAAIPAALCAAALGACGGGEGEGAERASARERFEDAQTRFAQCMRRNGVDVADPQDGRIVIGPGRGEGGKPPDSERFRRAEEKCSPILRDARPPEPSEAEQREFEERALAFARCMREQGVDVPDPEVDGGRVRQQLRPGANPDDPRWKRAGW
jgi:hypothetical protein